MREFAYGRDSAAQKLDLYPPGEAASNAPAPLVVWIHGGAWRSGDKRPAPHLDLLRSAGFAVASINYRLSGEATFPAQIHDGKAAIRWLRAHAADHQLDPRRIGVWGSSAGGHLAALLGTSGGVAELEGRVGDHLDQPSDVQAVCDWYGPTDLLRMSESRCEIDHDAADSPQSQLLGGLVQQRRAEAARANPITYLNAAAPPFLIMHGCNDRTVGILQSELLHAALTKAGVASEFIAVEGATHAGEGFDAERVRQFFLEHLGAA